MTRFGWAVIGLAGVMLATPVWSADRPNGFPAGKDVCFGRVYDEAHLAKNPRQVVTAMYLYNTVTPDALDEDRESFNAEIKLDDGTTQFVPHFMVRLRDRADLAFQFPQCQGTGDTMTCAVECDGGQFSTRMKGKSLLLTNEDITMMGVCELSTFTLPSDKDNKVFRLDPLPVSACLDARTSARPSIDEAGPRLREAFATGPEHCFSAALDGGGDGKSAWLRVKGEDFTFGVERRDGRRANTKGLSCFGSLYGYRCFDVNAEEVNETGSYDEALDPMILQRDGKDTITLSLRGNHFVDQVGGAFGATKLSLQRADLAACPAATP
jgi:hypothetical protein